MGFDNEDEDTSVTFHTVGDLNIGHRHAEFRSAQQHGHERPRLVLEWQTHLHEIGGTGDSCRQTPARGARRLEPREQGSAIPGGHDVSHRTKFMDELVKTPDDRRAILKADVRPDGRGA